MCGLLPRPSSVRSLSFGSHGEAIEHIMADLGSVELEYCNKCGRTNHVIDHVHHKGWAEVLDEAEGISIDGWDRWYTMRCQGCDSVQLRHCSYFSENVGPDGGPVVDTEYFPPRLSRRKPRWRFEIMAKSPKLSDFDAIVDEIYAALANGSNRLAAMGVRALVEQVMTDKVEDQGTFKATVKAFFDAGYVAPLLQPTFENTLIEAGHAAMHRGFNPEASTIDTLLDIIEPLMDDIYYKPLRADRARKTIPARSQ